MQNKIEKDKKKRSLYLKYEIKRKVLKSLILNVNLKLNVRQKAAVLLSSLPKDSSIVRIRNRCVLTGRGRGIQGGFHMSRLMFRKLGRDGLIQGLLKSS